MDISAQLSIARAIDVEVDRLKYKSEYGKYLKSVNHFHLFGRDRVCIKCGLSYIVYLNRLFLNIYDAPSCCIITNIT